MRDLLPLCLRTCRLRSAYIYSTYISEYLCCSVEYVLYPPVCLCLSVCRWRVCGTDCYILGFACIALWTCFGRVPRASFWTRVARHMRDAGARGERRDRRAIARVFRVLLFHTPHGVCACARWWGLGGGGAHSTLTYTRTPTLRFNVHSTLVLNLTLSTNIDRALFRLGAASLLPFSGRGRRRSRRASALRRSAPESGTRSMWAAS